MVMSRRDGFFLALVLLVLGLLHLSRAEHLWSANEVTAIEEEEQVDVVSYEAIADPESVEADTALKQLLRLIITSEASLGFTDNPVRRIKPFFARRSLSPYSRKQRQKRRGAWYAQTPQAPRKTAATDETPTPRVTSNGDETMVTTEGDLIVRRSAASNGTEGAGADTAVLERPKAASIRKDDLQHAAKGPDESEMDVLDTGSITDKEVQKIVSAAREKVKEEAFEKQMQAALAGLGGAVTGFTGGGLYEGIAANGELPWVPFVSAAVAGGLTTYAGLQKGPVGEFVREKIGGGVAAVGESVKRGASRAKDRALDAAKRKLGDTRDYAAQIPGRASRFAADKAKDAAFALAAAPGRFGRFAAEQATRAKDAAASAAKRKAQETSEAIRAVPGKVQQKASEAADAAIKEAQALPGRTAEAVTNVATATAGATKKAAQNAADEAKRRATEAAEETKDRFFNAVDYVLETPTRVTKQVKDALGIEEAPKPAPKPKAPAAPKAAAPGRPLDVGAPAVGAAFGGVFGGAPEGPKPTPVKTRVDEKPRLNGKKEPVAVERTPEGVIIVKSPEAAKRKPAAPPKPAKTTKKLSVTPVAEETRPPPRKEVKRGPAPEPAVTGGLFTGVFGGAPTTAEKPVTPVKPAVEEEIISAPKARKAPTGQPPRAAEVKPTEAPVPKVAPTAAPTPTKAPAVGKKEAPKEEEGGLFAGLFGGAPAAPVSKPKEQPKPAPSPALAKAVAVGEAPTEAPPRPKTFQEKQDALRSILAEPAPVRKAPPTPPAVTAAKPKTPAAPKAKEVTKVENVTPAGGIFAGLFGGEPPAPTTPKAQPAKPAAVKPAVSPAPKVSARPVAKPSAPSVGGLLGGAVTEAKKPAAVQKEVRKVTPAQPGSFAAPQEVGPKVRRQTSRPPSRTTAALTPPKPIVAAPSAAPKVEAPKAVAAKPAVKVAAKPTAPPAAEKGKAAPTEAPVAGLFSGLFGGAPAAAPVKQAPPAEKFEVKKPAVSAAPPSYAAPMEIGPKRRKTQGRPTVALIGGGPTPAPKPIVKAPTAAPKPVMKKPEIKKPSPPTKVVTPSKPSTQEVSPLGGLFSGLFGSPPAAAAPKKTPAAPVKAEIKKPAAPSRPAPTAAPKKPVTTAAKPTIVATRPSASSSRTSDAGGLFSGMFGGSPSSSTKSTPTKAAAPKVISRGQLPSEPQVKVRKLRSSGSRSTSSSAPKSSPRTPSRPPVASVTPPRAPQPSPPARPSPPPSSTPSGGLFGGMFGGGSKPAAPRTALTKPPVKPPSVAVKATPPPVKRKPESSGGGGLGKLAGLLGGAVSSAPSKPAVRKDPGADSRRAALSGVLNGGGQRQSSSKGKDLDVLEKKILRIYEQYPSLKKGYNPLETPEQIRAEAERIRKLFREANTPLPF